MCITADGQVNIVRDLHFDHGCFLVDNILDPNDDLVDVLLMEFLAVLESFRHVVNEFLGHDAILESYAVVGVLDEHVVKIETFGRGRFVADLDGGKEGHLAHNLLAFLQLEPCIFVVGV